MISGMEALGGLLAMGGCLLLLAGAVFFIIAAFREGILWGLGVLFVPFVSLIFLILAWPRARNSFYLQLYGVAAILIAAFAMHVHLPLLGR